MADRWFYWQKTFDSRWTPVIAAEPPSKKPEGPAPVTTGLHTLDARHAAWSLKECAEEYPAPQENT